MEVIRGLCVVNCTLQWFCVRVTSGCVALTWEDVESSVNMEGDSVGGGQVRSS